MRRGARIAAFEEIFASLFHDAAEADEEESGGDGDDDLIPCAGRFAAGDAPSAAVDRAYRDRIAQGFFAAAGRIEGAIRGAIDRPLVAVGRAERAALCAAAAELLSCPETPRAVVISEAIEIARLYGDDGADKFVNGVLDSVARRFAARERAARDGE